MGHFGCGGHWFGHGSSWEVIGEVLVASGRCRMVVQCCDSAGKDIRVKGVLGPVLALEIPWVEFPGGYLGMERSWKVLMMD